MRQKYEQLQIFRKNVNIKLPMSKNLILGGESLKQPIVSVIMPVYNGETYLRQCLDSVVNQTLKEIEIICVDDGSSDRSVEILKEYAAKDERVMVLQQANAGAGAARNNGLSEAFLFWIPMIFLKQICWRRQWKRLRQTGRTLWFFDAIII